MVAADTLLSNLAYEPQELRFGTSGRRGEIRHLTQLEIYINSLAELKYLQTLAPENGGIKTGEEVFFAYDLRPSSCRVDFETGRGAIAQAVVRAIEDAGMRAINLGAIPTPALTAYAIARQRGSIMITGSHIPFDRNGYKLNTSMGELLKEHEAPINANVRTVREQVYSQPFESSPFDRNGMLKQQIELPEASFAARDEYIQRYADFFSEASLQGWRILVYQHSAVGRDMLVQILRAFGAEVIPAGRSETFVPIDTENIGAAQLSALQELANGAGRLDAVVSIDGDSDRPLILGVQQGGGLRFFGGDLVGMVVADYLKADAVVVPISCNDSIDRSSLASILEPKTRIGSPFVIAAMEGARQRGRGVVCGWEANGGFLLGSDVVRNGKTLKALATRDAILPILCTLFSAAAKKKSLIDIFDSVVCRYSRAALLPNFPRAAALQIVGALSPISGVSEVVFEPEKTVALDAACQPASISVEPFDAVRHKLQQFFPAIEGFGHVAKINYTDGVRITFHTGEVAHVRPSGNADELRIYAVADTQQRADDIAALGVQTPNGILMRMKAELAG